MKNQNYEVEEPREARETKSRKHNVLSYLACVLAAIIIWLVIMNVTDHRMQGSVDSGADEQDNVVELSV